MNSFQALCDVCGQLFTNKYNLPKHMRMCHGREETAKVQCNVCDKFVTCLDSHMKMHTITRGMLLCTECDYRCYRRQQLRDHLETVHRIKMESKAIEFNCMRDFQQWKTKLEVDDNVSFRKVSAEKGCHYECHRSGCPRKINKTGQRLRAASIQMGRTCPASIKVTEHSTGKVSVQFNMTHTGHNLSVGSLRLSSADRAMVADQIRQGLPDGAILKKVRDSVLDGHITRLHLLDKQDISNIRREYKLDTSYAHVDDAVSVEMWVNEQQTLGADSSVVYYKPQSRVDEKLGNDSFMLVIMTPYQREMAKKFCKEKVLIDTTHGTNKYKFDLTTLLTVDEFGVGCPVAYCLSTQTDSLSMKVFFEQIRTHTGKITTKVFMSDDCDTYYNAWGDVMGESVNRLLCSWHVDRAWRRNIASKVKGDMYLKSEVYRALKVIQLQTDKIKFSELLNGFQHWCDADSQTREFGVYFATYYAGRTMMWASCFRTGLGINTNMYLEANHKTLKYCYLLKKINNRVDKAIHALLLQTRDLLFERLRRLAKGLLKTARIAAITRSHKASLKISEDMIACIEDDTWHVQPHRNRPHHTVTYADMPCMDCPLSCAECKVCVHKYNCSCMDNLVRGNMCCHIHAVAIHRNTVVPVQDRFQREPCVQGVMQAIKQEPSTVASVGHRAAFQARITMIQDLAKSATDETSGSLLGSLDKIIQVLKEDLKVQQQLPDHLSLAKATTSGNEKCKRQRQFHSVKKVNARHNHSLRGPSYSETMEITEGLLHRACVDTGNDLATLEVCSLPDRTLYAATKPVNKRKMPGDNPQVHNSNVLLEDVVHVESAEQP